jgi:nucleoside-diphosphate-sugar epimerase
MNCFLTGATGFIGNRLAERLSAEGHSVRCLVRSPDKFRMLSHLPGLSPVVGDLDNIAALKEGVRGCDMVFHLAAYAKPWSKNKSTPRRINVTGTENLLNASLEEGVRRFIFTSSAAVIGPSPGVEPIDENFTRSLPYFNEYEETKAEAEDLVGSFCRDGMETLIVNPSRVYGPGLVNESNSVTRMIKLYSLGKWHIVPGDGKYIGNYVLVDEVVKGHILAALRGRPGQRYALGGENLTFDQFFEILAVVTGKRSWLIHLPVRLMIMAAKIMEWQATVTGIAPLITAPWVKKYLNHWSLSSDKAMRELGYGITPFREGVKITLEWLKKEEETE